MGVPGMNHRQDLQVGGRVLYGRRRDLPSHFDTLTHTTLPYSRPSVLENLNLRNLFDEPLNLHP